MDEVSERLGNANPPVAFDSGQAMGSFLNGTTPSSRISQPDDWGLELVEDSMVVAPDTPQVLHVELDLGSSASAMVAVRLVDRATGEVFLSPLLPIAATGNAPPSITIETPGGDLDRRRALSYDDYGSGNKSYGYVNVEASADDPEDGQLSRRIDRLDDEPDGPPGRVAGRGRRARSSSGQRPARKAPCTRSRRPHATRTAVKPRPNG